MTNLQQLRLKKGWTQPQLAKASGITLRTIQAYEIDFRDINKASMDIVFKLCNALECEVGELLTDKKLVKLIDNYIDNIYCE